MGSAARKSTPAGEERRQRVERGVGILRHDMDALRRIADGLDDDFAVAVDRIARSKGSLIVCGIGKAGLIGRKLAATFASTGTRAHFLHPAEALHGDLGCIDSNDLVLILSNSGSTQEVVDLLPYVTRRAAGIIAITSGANSPLASASDVAMILPPIREACQHNLAPTTSTLAMLALGDALAMVVSEAKGFRVDDFAELHPGGALGRKLAQVDEAMRGMSECRVSSLSISVRQMLVEVSKPGRRSGAVMVVDAQGALTGIFTDSDLAKMLEQRRESQLDCLVEEVMTRSFSAIQSGARLSDAIAVMRRRKISELPVVNADDHPIGMIDITDLLGLDPWGMETTASTRVATKSDVESEPESDEGSEWTDGPATLRIFGPLR